MGILNMNWEAVSSQVIRTSYNTETEELIVEFKTGKYKYFKVPNEVYEKLKTAQSIGKFINSDIKGQFDYIKLS